MKQDRRILIIVGLLLFAALVIWWLKPSPNAPFQSTSSTPAQSYATTPMPSSTGGQQLMSIPSAEELAKSPEEKRERYVEKSLQYAETANRPLSFYGQILDQNNQGLDGVLVRCELNYFSLASMLRQDTAHEHMELISDRNGRFAIENRRGLSLDVRLHAKEGYVFKDNGVLGASFQGQEASSISTFEKPYIFHAFKKGKAELLIEGAIAFYDCVPDGRSYVFDLKRKRVVEGTQGGEFSVSLQRPPGNILRDDYDWSLQIEGVNDELAESHAEFMYQAPASGYAATWSFVQRAGEPNYAREVTPKFYLKSRDGSRYGRIELRITSKYRDKAAVLVNYWLNPSGSRNLEPSGDHQGAGR